MICSDVIVTFGCLYKQTFRKMSLNDSVLPENILNEAEQTLNSYSLTRIAWRVRCAQEETSESL
jgi:hypothetical protein